MEYTTKITDASKLRVQDTGEELISVQFDIMCDGEVVLSSRHGFPLDSTPEFIEGEVEAALQTYISDEEGKLRNAEHDLADAQADETITALLGKPEPAPEEVVPLQEGETANV